jgi:hypothetical protein
MERTQIFELMSELKLYGMKVNGPGFAGGSNS